MNNSSIVGEILETGQSAVKQGLGDFAKTVVGQITGNQNDQGTNEQANAAKQKMSDDSAKSFLRDLYGKSDKGSDLKSDQNNSSQAKTNSNPQNLAQAPKNPNEGKNPEELLKIEALRKKLHGDYYQTLVNPSRQKEERATEKIEREEQEEEMELWQKEKKKPPKLPVNVKQGTGEKMVGVSG